MSNPLEPVMEWYATALDSIRVTTRVLEKSVRGAITQRHVFHGEPLGRSRDRLVTAKLRLADLVVLELVATFERTLRGYLIQRAGQSLAGTDAVDRAMLAKISDDIEFWRLSDHLLEVFAGHVGPALVGAVKPVIYYRDWIAHGRPLPGPKGGTVIPQTAFHVLTRFLVAAKVM